MAKPNYSFEKRQRELAKKKKKEEKLQEKAARKANPQPVDAMGNPIGPAPDEAADTDGDGDNDSQGGTAQPQP